MKTLLAILILATLSTSAMACGKERWEVKTTIPDVVQFKSTTIEELSKFKAPTRKELTAKQGRYEQEEYVYQVVAKLVGYKVEADGDYHLVITDGTRTMIAEIPSATCTQDKVLGARWTIARKFIDTNYGKATAKYKKLDNPPELILTGPFFFDFIHGQTGVAKNGVELHPIIHINRAR